jgi:hypothetical protein
MGEHGAIAQMGERLHGMQEVGGSIPPGSTKFPIILHAHKKMLSSCPLLFGDFVIVLRVMRTDMKAFGLAMERHQNLSSKHWTVPKQAWSKARATLIAKIYSVKRQKYFDGSHF